MIPQLWIALATAALVTQRAVQDLVGERPFQLRRLELIYEGRVVDDPGAVGRIVGRFPGTSFNLRANVPKKAC